MIRVLVAEESVTLRALLVEILGSDPEIEVVGESASGGDAVEQVVRLRPDLVTMDIHLPGLDGLEATKEIMYRAPVPIIIVSSGTSRMEIDRSFHAIAAGAVMALPKPDDPSHPEFEARKGQLLSMVKALAGLKMVTHRRFGHRAPQALPDPGRSEPNGPVRLVVVGASTGGPASLEQLLRSLPMDFPAPLAVVQHMAPGFIGGLAEWLGARCALRVGVAREGDQPEGRRVYLAPGGAHLVVARPGVLRLEASPPVDGHRPSVTRLFETAAKVYGKGVVGVLLSGMGRDGVEGLRAIRAEGGRTVVQDGASSAVFGMPGAAVQSGLADDCLPPERIAARLVEVAHQGAT